MSSQNLASTPFRWSVLSPATGVPSGAGDGGSEELSTSGSADGMSGMNGSGCMRSAESGEEARPERGMRVTLGRPSGRRVRVGPLQTR